MDSLAAPQDRLVEQLLSPRTQAQRRLKVCGAGGGMWVSGQGSPGRDGPARGQVHRWRRGPAGAGRLGAGIYK